MLFLAYKIIYKMKTKKLKIDEGTGNFSSNISPIYAIEIEDEWDYGDTINNIRVELKNEFGDDYTQDDTYTDDRNYSGKIIANINGGSAAYEKTVGNDEYDFEVGFSVNIIIREGYYSGANLDYEVIYDGQSVDDYESYTNIDNVISDATDYLTSENPYVSGHGSTLQYAIVDAKYNDNEDKSEYIYYESLSKEQQDEIDIEAYDIIEEIQKELYNLPDEDDITDKIEKCFAKYSTTLNVSAQFSSGETHYSVANESKLLELSGIKQPQIIIEKKINEGLDIMQKIGEVATGQKLVGLRNRLETIFSPKSIDFVFDPIAHFRIKHGGRTIILVNKEYASDAELIVGDIAIGYEGKI